jgi:hypothetical protein
MKRPLIDFKSIPDLKIVLRWIDAQENALISLTGSGLITELDISENKKFFNDYRNYINQEIIKIETSLCMDAEP